MKPSDHIKHLLPRGWTEASIAEKVGCVQSTINRIKAGSATTYAIGAAILALKPKRRASKRKA